MISICLDRLLSLRNKNGIWVLLHLDDAFFSGGNDLVRRGLADLRFLQKLQFLLILLLESGSVFGAKNCNGFFDSFLRQDLAPSTLWFKSRLRCFVMDPQSILFRVFFKILGVSSKWLLRPSIAGEIQVYSLYNVQFNLQRVACFEGRKQFG